MLIHFFLLFFLFESTALITSAPGVTTRSKETTVTVKASTSSPSTPESPRVQLVATPDYPVAAGQKVVLHCNAFSMPNLINLTLHHLENQNWETVSSGGDLTLTEPKESGLYRCSARNNLSQTVLSQNHTVFIISRSQTGGEILGIAAFYISLLVLIISLAVILWLVWQRLGNTLTISSNSAKGFPEPAKPPNSVGLSDSNKGDDVYMNYTRTNQAYTDLDPTNMTSDNVYSCLS